MDRILFKKNIILKPFAEKIFFWSENYIIDIRLPRSAIDLQRQGILWFSKEKVVFGSPAENIPWRSSREKNTFRGLLPKKILWIYSRGKNTSRALLYKITFLCRRPA